MYSNTYIHMISLFTVVLLLPSPLANTSIKHARSFCDVPIIVYYNSIQSEIYYENYISYSIVYLYIYRLPPLPPTSGLLARLIALAKQIKYVVGVFGYIGTPGYIYIYHIYIYIY